MDPFPSLRAAAVTDDERTRFQRNGFLVVDRPVVGEPARRRVRELLDDLFDRAKQVPRVWVHDLAPSTQNGSIPEIINTSHVEPRLLQTDAYRMLHQVARRLLGGPVWLAIDHAIFKPPHKGVPTALHQDRAFNPRSTAPTATIWLALVDATVYNGCMRFLPETPDRLLDHRPAGRDALEVIGVEESAALACPVPAGGFTVHGELAVHGSGTNETDDVRAAWILKFAPDTRSFRQRAWERSVELQGAVLPRRFAELSTAIAQSADATVGHPKWAEPGVSGGHEPDSE